MREVAQKFGVTCGMISKWAQKSVPSHFSSLTLEQMQQTLEQMQQELNILYEEVDVIRNLLKKQFLHKNNWLLDEQEGS